MSVNWTKVKFEQGVLNEWMNNLFGLKCCNVCSSHERPTQLAPHKQTQDINVNPYKDTTVHQSCFVKKKKGWLPHWTFGPQKVIYIPKNFYDLTIKNF